MLSRFEPIKESRANNTAKKISENFIYCSDCATRRFSLFCKRTLNALIHKECYLTCGTVCNGAIMDCKVQCEAG